MQGIKKYCIYITQKFSITLFVKIISNKYLGIICLFVYEASISVLGSRQLSQRQRGRDKCFPSLNKSIYLKIDEIFINLSTLLQTFHSKAHKYKTEASCMIKRKKSSWKSTSGASIIVLWIHISFVDLRYPLLSSVFWEVLIFLMINYFIFRITLRSQMTTYNLTGLSIWRY